MRQSSVRTRVALVTILGMVAALLPIVALPAVAADSSTVFINEFHYDNDGTDTGEGVEIAGPAGTDLAGWSLVFYTGSNGTVYMTENLTGIIPDQENSHGTVHFPIAGIQNGSPDGIALVGPSGVEQFLSYEGAFTAVGGAADGMLSEDIGIDEVQSGSTPEGNSLFLVGSGTTYGDFTWASGVNSFGLINTGQTFSAITGEAVLVINEIDYDQPSTDFAEFVEITNVGTAAADLSAYSLRLVNGSNGTTYQEFALPAVSLVPGDYFVVCGDAANVDSCDLDVAPDSNLIQNGAPDAVALIGPGSFGATIVDTVSYEGDTAGYTEGSGVGLEDDSSVGDLGISRFPDGTDTNVNNVDFSQRCITPGAANTAAATDCEPPPAAELVINEIDYDQAGTDAAEFLEIANVGAIPVDLSLYTVKLINGNGNTEYQSFALPAVVLAAGDYFVVCGDAANVENCDLDVSPDTNLIQNGAPDAAALLMGETLVDTVSYEGNVAGYTEGSGVGLEDDPDLGYSGLSRFPDGTDTNVNNADFSQRCITPGAANAEATTGCEPIPVEMCGDPFTPIPAIQGDGLASPLADTEVATEGVVVGDFQNNGSVDNGDLNGFHIQDPNGDDDPATSDGIFVFAPGGVDVNPGDAVRVRGTVSEFFDLTEIGNVSLILVCSTGNEVAPTPVSLPVTAVDDFESFEGMLVEFPQSLFISEYFNFDRFGEIVLTSERHLTPTAEFEPGPDAIAEAAAIALDRITLDDGRTSQNPDPAIHPNGGIFDLTNLFRGGDTVANVTGVMDFAFSLYRVQPTTGADYTNTNPRPATPDDVGGNLEVASFNVLNYFTTLDNAGSICGPNADQGCRGADDAGEFTRQRDKIVAALAIMDSDVVGLTEIENYPGDVPTADLVDGLNDVMGAGTYDYIPTGAIGPDAIRVAFIYKPASVSPVGPYAILDESVDARFLEDFNRPALAQTFIDNTTGGIFTAAVNHLKSKGSNCDAVGDFDLGDGQGNCNLTRTAAAEALVDWLAGDPTGSGDEDFLIIGDLNSYDKEDPIDAIVDAGYTDLLFALIGEGAYSYVFDGQIGYLDHSLANPGILDEVTGVTVWHINADEPDLIDYDTSFKRDAQDAIYAPDAYRSSDHDPVIVGLNVCDEIAPTIEVSVTPDTLWPPKHQYVGVTATVIAADNFDTDPTVTLLSVTSNEPDNGLGDGDKANDIVIVDDLNFLLRAERSGLGNGRVYTITYQVTDDCGNSAIGTAEVYVPFSQSSKN
ncbi:MAG: ExeM/NucH family extracellular endonuclease [Acidimicrobiia bacterium]|nr:ExeM/NucH family extracellular endonuclease [Acidimicrobiia bacterium]